MTPVALGRAPAWLALAASLLVGLQRPTPRPDDVAADPAAAIRFAALEVVFDTGDAELAAWQVELEDPTGRATILGVEGGRPEAFRETPYHDRRALGRGRIVLAACQPRGPLPSGRARVALLHVRVEGPGEPDFRFRGTVAAERDGTRFDARVTVEERR